jgi:RND family efflux transporter MFP subunit
LNELNQDLASLRIDRGAAAPAAPRRRLWIGVAVAAVATVALVAGLRLRARLGTLAVTIARPALLPAGGTPAGTPLLSASGYVVPRRKAVVSAKIQGRLADLRVEEGSRVAEGEVIARLESADLRAQVQQARATILRAEADLAEARRQERLSADLAREKVVSQDALDAARSKVRIGEAALEQAKADLEVAQARFADTLIRAPFAGVVVKKMAEIGESVAPIPPGVNISTSTGAIVALADLDTLEVEADVAESNVARLGDAQPAEVTVEAFPDRRYRAALRQVIPTADRTKATVQVKVTILDRDRNLKPEMTARVTFLSPPAAPAAVADPGAGTPPRWLVPRDCLATRDGRRVVYEVRDGRAIERVVATATDRGDQAIVSEGLAGTEALVVRPPESLRDGNAVRVEN